MNLSDLLTEAEALFADYRARFPLAICQCAVCMPPDEQQLFLKTPLAELSEIQLQSYNASVPQEGADEKYIAEIKYFLPRILRGLCDGEDIATLTETTLQRLDLHRHDCWSPQERDFMRRFAHAFIAARCHDDDAHPMDGIGNYLLMFHWAGMADEIPALCEVWTQHAQQLAALRSFSDLLEYLDWLQGDIDWRKAFYLPEHCPARETFVQHLQDWIHHPDTRRAFQQGFEHAILNDLGDNDERQLWQSWYDWLDSEKP